MVWQSKLIAGDGPASNSPEDRKMSLEILEKKVELHEASDKAGVNLKREIGLFSAVNLTVGTMIGKYPTEIVVETIHYF